MEGGVTKKNPKRVEAGMKRYQARLLKLKGEILAGTSISNTGTTPSTMSGNNSGSTASSPDTTKGVYIYGVGLVAILAVGLCLFYTFKGGKPASCAASRG